MGKEKKIEATYDPELDALAIHFGDRKDDITSEDVAPGIIVDYDEQGHVVGIEVLDASRFTPFVPSTEKRRSVRQAVTMNILTSPHRRTISVATERESFGAGEVAALLGVHPTTVWRWIRAGLLRGERIGHGKGTYRIPASEVERFERDARPTVPKRLA